MKIRKKKKKLPNPLHFATQRTYRGIVTPTKKELLNRLDKKQKQQGWKDAT